MRQTKQTKKEIAQALGISRISLDRVLKGQPGVGQDKRDRVLRYLEQNAFRENRLAQSLVRGQSRSLGIIVFDLENSFYAQLVNAFARTAQAADYESYIMLSNKDPRQEKRLLEALLARQVDGIVVNSAVPEADYGDYLLSQPCPILSLMNRVDPRLPFLGFDEYASMRELVAYALERGYRRFFYVCPPLERADHSNMDSLIGRQQGFMDAVKDRGDLDIHLLGDQHYLEHLLAADFDSAHKPCLICTSDIYAVQIQSALRQRGLVAPQHYAIAGYDNIPVLRDMTPRLTTVSLQIAQLGETAARLLLGAAQGQALPLTTLMAHELIRQDTL